METVKHTPGPWEASESDNDGREFIMIEHLGFPIGYVRGTNDMSCIDEEDEAKIAAEVVATARLICAAPDLLEALQSLIGMAEDGYKLHVKNASHQEFLNEDKEALSNARSIIRKAKGL